jgi:hypothetical protein
MGKVRGVFSSRGFIENEYVEGIMGGSAPEGAASGSLKKFDRWGEILWTRRRWPGGSGKTCCPWETRPSGRPQRDFSGKISNATA